MTFDRVRYMTRRFVLILCRSSSQIKVMGQSSRSGRKMLLKWSVWRRVVAFLVERVLKRPVSCAFQRQNVLRPMHCDGHTRERSRVTRVWSGEKPGSRWRRHYRRTHSVRVTGLYVYVRIYMYTSLRLDRLRTALILIVSLFIASRRRRGCPQILSCRSQRDYLQLSGDR